MEAEKKQNKVLFLIPVGCCVVLILAVLLLSGCQTSSVDALNVDSPQTLAAPSAESTRRNGEFASATPTIPENTEAAKNGYYPKIGRERNGAAEQLSKADTTSIRDELRHASESSSQRATTKPADAYQDELAELRKKAATHGKDALKKIEEATE